MCLQSFQYDHIWPVSVDDSVSFLLHLALGGICTALQNEVSKEALVQWNTQRTFFYKNPIIQSIFTAGWLKMSSERKDFCEVNLLLASLNYLPSDFIFHWQCQISPEVTPYKRLIIYAHCFILHLVRFSEIHSATLHTQKVSKSQKSGVSQGILLLDWRRLRISLNWWVNQASCWACKSMCLLSFPDRSMEPRNGLWMAKKKKKKDIRKLTRWWNRPDSIVYLCQECPYLTDNLFFPPRWALLHFGYSSCLIRYWRCPAVI